MVAPSRLERRNRVGGALLEDPVDIPTGGVCPTAKQHGGGASGHLEDGSSANLAVVANGEEAGMAKYLISFPSGAMHVPEDEMAEVAEAAHAVVQETKDAGVFVFAGGLDETIDPVVVSADGTVTEGSYPETKELSGGFTIVEVPSREEAMEWARKIAVACRCGQEVRVFQYDPLV
jgi:hypothetical protein